MLSGDDTEELGPSLPFAPQVHVEYLHTVPATYRGSCVRLRNNYIISES